MTPFVTVDQKKVGSDYPPYIIAEMSANHNGSLEAAIKIIEAAKNAGADAVKLQAYLPQTITLDSDADEFRIKGGLWDGRTLFDLYQEAHTPWDWFPSLFDKARDLDITLFSSVFDSTSVDMLEALGASAYKIASFEAVDLPLIKYTAATGKPLIISTGMADMNEITEAIEAAQQGGCQQLAILHCVSGYPAPAGDYNLKTLLDMQDRYGLVTGLSDHTLDNTTAIASVALGASIIEKHFTLDRSGGGPDDSFSLEPDELTALCRDTRTAWEALGRIDYGKKSSEQGNVQFRRSLYFVKPLKAGDAIATGDVRSVRPGYGIAPGYLEQLTGMQVSRDIDVNTPVQFADLIDGESLNRNKTMNNDAQ